MEALADFLQGGRRPSSEESARLAHSVELILAGQPARVRSLLDWALAQRDAAGRLIGLLPDRLLTRVLLFLRPAEHYRVQRSADILADARLAKELGLEPVRVAATEVAVHVPVLDGGGQGL